MTNEKSYVDIEFVKAIGSMPSHDIDAVEALYPGFFERSAEAASRKFDDRAVAENEREQVRRHVAALVIADIWAKRGTNTEPETDALVVARKSAAVQWLANSKTVDEVRKSAAPPPVPLKAEHIEIPAHDPFPNLDEARHR